MTSDLQQQVKETSKVASVLAQLDSGQKNAVLAAMADAIEANSQAIIAANEKDLAYGKSQNLSAAMLDRLLLDESRIRAMAESVREVSQLPDPVGVMTASQLRPNGIRVGQMQIPIGVILMIYESRPNVTVEASSLCFKSGNAIVLRGGSEAFYSNTCIADLLKACLREHALPDSLIQMVSTRERSVLNDLLTMHESIDLVIPRGGQSLIEYVSENSRIPVIQHYKGVCHLYVDEHADLEQACRLLINGKAQRPGVCNALETCLVHENTASEFLKLAKTAIEQANIEVRGCAVTCQHLSSAKAAVEQDYYEEFLDTIIAMKVVPDMASAIDHIRQYGSQHTEVICTENYSQAQAFMRAVNSSVVMVNASSRFSDGGQLGLGAEIGISTSKLHAYGPMGLDALTTKKFVVFGNGQIRE